MSLRVCESSCSMMLGMKKDIKKATGERVHETGGHNERGEVEVEVEVEVKEHRPLTRECMI